MDYQKHGRLAAGGIGGIGKMECKKCGLDPLRENAVRALPQPARQLLGPLNTTEVVHAPAVQGALLDEWAKEAKDIGGISRDHRRTVDDYATAYRRETVSVTDVIEAVLGTIERFEESSPPLRAVIATNADAARVAARGSQHRHQHGKPLSIWDGVPIVASRQYNVGPDLPATHGTSFLPVRRQVQDHPVLSRLKAAGAIVIGTTNVDELGVGVRGHNPHWGVSRNPHNTSFVAGGANGGAAAAVAAGIVPVAVAIDFNGGVRIPAAACGVVSIKPTHGRNSFTQPLAWSLGSAAAIGIGVKDAAAVYAMLSGDEDVPHDIRPLRQPVVQLHGFNDIEDLSDVKIGMWTSMLGDVEPAVASSCNHAKELLQARGAQIVELQSPPQRLVRLSQLANLVTLLAELSYTISNLEVGFNGTSFTSTIRLMASVGTAITAEEMIAAQILRNKFKQTLQKLLERSSASAGVDAVILPMAAEAQPPTVATLTADQGGWSEVNATVAAMGWAGLANFIGLPSMSMPVGFDRSTSLPQSVQLLSWEWNEHILFRVAHALEDAVVSEGNWPRPSMYASHLDSHRACAGVARPDHGNWGTCPTDGSLGDGEWCKLKCAVGSIMFDNKGQYQPHCMDGKLTQRVRCMPKPAKNKAKSTSTTPPLHPASIEGEDMLCKEGAQDVDGTCSTL